MKSKVEESIEKIDGWIERNGWNGYDPYDLKGTPFFIRIQQFKPNASKVNEGIRRLIFGLANKYPITMRRLFRVEEELNPKAMALFAHGYLKLHRTYDLDSYLQKAQECLEWLKEHPSQGHSGLCWGYPFDWQSRIFIPKGTPSAVVTSIAAHSFLDAYEETGERTYLDIAESACEFLTTDLNKDQIDEARLCFSYTPIDHFHVHNANLFAASLLSRVGNKLKNEKYTEDARMAVNYTLGEQNLDGSWCYWGSTDQLPCYIDHYHTGFVLRCLYLIYKIGGGEELHAKIQKGFDYYTKNLFKDETIPKLTPKSTYPIDIHSCSEAILCLGTLDKEFPGASKILRNTTEWILQNMQDKKGYFYYRIYGNGHIDRTPYIRWSQAWMLAALSTISGRSE